MEPVPPGSIADGSILDPTAVAAAVRRALVRGKFSGREGCVSLSGPLTNASVNFNGGDSTTATGASIVEYAWDFGNGSTLTGTSATASSTYTAARTYTIRLTIRDSAGRTATVTKTLTVTAPGA